MTKVGQSANRAPMKLATYNLNGIRARLPRLVEWLTREQPDVVCLQELKCADESLPIADIEAAGYGAVWHGQRGFNGVAIPAIPTIPTAAISRPRFRDWSSRRSICPTAIQWEPKSSTTSSAGWSGCAP